MRTFDSYHFWIDKDFLYSVDPGSWKFGVIVFTRPEDAICDKIVGPSLRYLHELTDDKIDFFFVGFSGRQGWGYETQVSSDFYNDGSKWFFSPSAFAKTQSKFEKLTKNKWKYSGGTDLLALAYSIRKSAFVVDSGQAIDIKLSKIAAKSDHYLPEEIIQILIREFSKGKDIKGVSNSKVIDGIMVGLESSFLTVISKGLADSYKALKPFAVSKLR